MKETRYHHVFNSLIAMILPSKPSVRASLQAIRGDGDDMAGICEELKSIVIKKAPDSFMPQRTN